MSEQLQIQPETSLAPVTVVMVPRVVEMFSISGPELDTVTTPSVSAKWPFFGTTVGSAIAFGITVLTIDLPGNRFASFVALFAVTSLLAAYFGIAAFLETRSGSETRERHITEIRKRPTSWPVEYRVARTPVSQDNPAPQAPAPSSR